MIANRTSMTCKVDPPRSFAASALSITLLISIPAVLTLSREWSAIGIAALVLLPLLIIWIQTEQLILLEPIFVIGAMWIIAVSLPIIIPHISSDVYRDQSWQSLPEPSLDAAALWMYRGWASCCIAYWVYQTLGTIQVRVPATAEQYQRENHLRVLVGCVGLFFTIVFLLTTGNQSYSHLEGFASTSTVDQIIFELRQMSLVYIFLFSHARAENRLHPKEGHLIAAILAVDALVFAGSGSKNITLELLAMALLGGSMTSLKRPRMRTIAVAVGVLLGIYLTFYLVTAYRVQLVAMDLRRSDSIVDTLSIQFDALWSALSSLTDGSELGNEENPYNVTSIFDRLAYLGSFASLVAYTNGVPPYENAYSSFISPILAFIPRDLFDQKVHFFGSGDFAQLLGWSFGGVSVSTPGSLYWAWGFEGVLFGMAGIGVLMSMSHQMSKRVGTNGLIWRSMFARLVVILLNVGAEFQAMMINLTRTLTILLILYLVSGQFRSAEGRFKHAK